MTSIWRLRPSLRLWGVAALLAATAGALEPSIGVAHATEEPINPPPRSPAENRVVDGNAEGLAGWENSDFVINAGWQAVYPAPLWGPYWGAPSAPVFQASVGGAAITQTDSLSDLAGSIDAGTQTLWAQGDFGGSGSSADGAYMTVQLLNSVGEPVGTAYQYGPPTQSDRLNSTIMVPCGGEIKVPPGTRMARITVRAEESAGETSNGTADELTLRLEQRGRPAVGFSNPTIPGNYVRMSESGGQGPNCGHAEIFTVAGSPSRPSESTGPSHPSPSTSSVARVSGIELSRSHLKLRISSAAKLDILITPVLDSLLRHAHHGASGQSQSIKVTLANHTAGLVVYRFRHRLAIGRYHLRLTVVASNAIAESHILRVLSIH
jgi:hypothetical protein